VAVPGATAYVLAAKETADVAIDATTLRSIVHTIRHELARHANKPLTSHSQDRPTRETRQQEAEGAAIVRRTTWLRCPIMPLSTGRDLRA